MKNKYTAGYFIKKFSAIPNKLWTTSAWRRWNQEAKTFAYCAMGHCGAGTEHYNKEEGSALANLFSQRLGESVMSVNDGLHEAKAIKQKTPRGRILAALKIIQKRRGRK